MLTPTQLFHHLRGKVKRTWRLAFFSAVMIGLLVHLPAMLSDVPNHDGLASMYFDQNMITSGRWFLMVACGFSSFYTIPWLIGLLGILFLGFSSAALTELLEMDRDWAIVLCSGLLVTFPALASTFAYVFTLDGYMLALFLAVLAVLITKKYRLGFLGGAVCLAFSLGTYQAYLSFAMVLSLFAVLMLFAGGESLRNKVVGTLRFSLMGLLGGVLYYVILQVLLRIQGKELASYQGINGIASKTAGEGLGFLQSIKRAYTDFLAFSFRGNVLFQNVISLTAIVLLVLTAAVLAMFLVYKRKWWKNPLFFAIIIIAAAIVPVVTNIILFVSPEVTYHLLMRYQWVLYLIGLTAFVSGNGRLVKHGGWPEWLGLAAAFTLIFSYAVADNIGYSNLQKRYEKTYAYCVRLLDRIEQTEGYYQGIPIAMIGVVSDDEYPVTDITLPVTKGMIGLSSEGSDSLLYTSVNYQEFMKHYLGATLNILPAEAMAQMYYLEEYIEMDSFPGKDSIRIIDGIMYIKTEDSIRE